MAELSDFKMLIYGKKVLRDTETTFISSERDVRSWAD